MKIVRTRTKQDPYKVIKQMYEEHGVADAIFMADAHLNWKTPIARTDNFMEAMYRKLNFIGVLQSMNDNCPIYHAGDLFDYWDPPYWFFVEVAKRLPKNFHSVYGNHDLPQHSYAERHRCGLYALDQTTKHIKALDFGYWNYVPNEEDGIVIKGRRLMIWHICVFQVKEKWMDNIDSSHALKLLKKYPQYDVIVTGDNHKPFIEEYKGRYLVNCGSMLRTTAAQADYKPHVYLWYAESNKIIPVPLPISPNVISRDHLEVKEARNERIETFVKSFDTWESGLDFEANLKTFEIQQKPEPEVMEIVYKSIDPSNSR